MQGFSWEQAAAVIYPVISGNSPYPKNVVSLKLLSEAALVPVRGGRPLNQLWGFLLVRYIGFLNSAAHLPTAVFFFLMLPSCFAWP